MARARCRFLSGLTITVGATMALLVGCGDDAACEDDASCGAGGDGGAGGSMATMMTTSTTATSSSTGLPMECDPLLLMPGQALSADCGVFVEPGATSGDGSQGSPYGTITEALADNPMSMPIYVCSSAMSVNEAIILTGSERLVGGVDCSNWEASTNKTPWTAAPNEIPLVLDGASAIIQSFAITAQDATGFDAATLDGNDSIAVVVNGGDSAIVNSDLVAGAGAAGGDGMDYPSQAPGRQSDAASFDGNSGSNGMGSDCGDPPGANKMYNSCPAGGSTVGAAGGAGGIATGSSGQSGLTDPGLGEPNGTAGAGDSGSPWTCAGNQGHGETGHDGPEGPFGAAGMTSGVVVVDGFLGSVGGAGMAGTTGQGGGGGGGRRGDASTGCAGVNGPAGGSGGAGGCGGQGGGGGGQGGASFALVSIGATVTLNSVTLVAVAGGTGGEGGDGQLGGIGGVSGPGGAFGCNGGSGGNGGPGGPGGGGAGGPSHGLAYTGTAPDIDDSAITVAGAPASGGAGGNGNSAMNGGAMGLTTKKQMY